MDMVLIEALITGYIAWIGDHTPYEVSHVSVPRVEFHSQKKLNHMFYNGMTCKKGESPNIAALYGEKYGGTEYLRKSFNEKDPEDQSTLFHETFHHVQYSNKDWMPETSHDREVEAMAVENMWRDNYGLKRLGRQVSADLCK